MSDEIKTIDRRLHPRTEVILKVEYPDLDGFLQDYTLNISQGGTMVRVNRQLTEGDIVEMIFSFPGLLLPIHLRGIVRWTQQNEGEDLMAGVEFEQDNSEAWDSLDYFVTRIIEGDMTVVTPIVHILVVEDNPHVARLICDGLEAYRKRISQPIAFETQYAADGKEALELLKERPWDILLTDIYLPVMDGELLIREIRDNPEWKQLPIIALSAGGDEAKVRALDAGADFFLDKPIRLSDVLVTMHKLLSSFFTETE